MSALSNVATFFKQKLQKKSTTTQSSTNITPTITIRKVQIFDSPLPIDVWKLIFSFVPLDDLVRIGCTCLFMYSFTEQDNLWQAVTTDGKILPPFESWKSTWSHCRQYISWQLIKEKTRVINRKSKMRPEAGVHHVKLVLLGPSGAGKSCLLQMMVNPNYFTSGFCVSSETTPPTTIGASFNAMQFQSSYFPPGPPQLKFNVHLDVWDTAGQERFRSLNPLYTRNATALVFVYDTAWSYGPDPLAEVDALRETISESKTVPCILVGLKIDLPRKVPQAKALEFARERNMAYVELSTRSGKHVDLPFLFATVLSSPNHPKQLTKLLCALPGYI